MFKPWLRDASRSFETYFLKLQCMPENVTFSSFFMFFFLAPLFPTFFCFLPLFSCEAGSVLSAASSALSASPHSSFPFLSALPILCFWTVDQNSERQYDFLFQPVWWKWRGINLTKMCVTEGYRSHLGQKKERRLPWEVRAPSQRRSYFDFSNNKGNIKKD